MPAFCTVNNCTVIVCSCGIARLFHSQHHVEQVMKIGTLEQKEKIQREVTLQKCGCYTHECTKNNSEETNMSYIAQVFEERDGKFYYGDEEICFDFAHRLFGF
jgi:hypothetical protein